jgi:hypothetical protein
MNGDEAGEITLAFSLSAIERLDDPKAAFEDAESWSRSIGLVDDDTERIERLVEEHDLRQDYDVRDRDKWFVLEELCETAATPRHVYVGASDEDMRVSTLFCWEYVRVTTAAEKAGWAISEARSDSGIGARLLARVRALIE